MTGKPLPDFLRPTTLSQLVGQDHLLCENSILGKSVANKNLPSLILWGPPGSGKTTLARLLVSKINAELIQISAVLSGVKDIRIAIEQAQTMREKSEKVVVFVDEVHRFNKSQQDAFLPHIESGLFVFIGATTENPGFEINSALRSRTHILILKTLNNDALRILLKRGLKALNIADEIFTESAINFLINHADGDGRRLLNTLESICENKNIGKSARVTINELKDIFPQIQRSFDKKGDQFYDQISAFHKSIRGSDPDAALYWMSRMIDGGIDPRYLARRIIRIASEDIGLADPRALSICLDAANAYDRLGSPEGELALAEAIIFIAIAAKSNATYRAFNASKKFVEEHSSDPVPVHLRNASTSFEKKLEYGKEYNYSHDSLDGISKNQCYFPDNLSKLNHVFYKPVARGLELKISQKLSEIKSKRNGN